MPIKTIKISPEDFKLLQKYKKRDEEIKKNENVDSLRMRKLQLKWIEREITFKEDQLKIEIIEKDDKVINGIKPRFAIENDLDLLNLKKEDHNIAIKELKKKIKEEKNA